jgi:pyruvate/2-oxoglutarate dehydrogenase complex dihydrolipoamide acyltransferase (E2) component
LKLVLLLRLLLKLLHQQLLLCICAAAASTQAVDQNQAPAVRKALSETGINAADVQGTGRGGRITKEDVAAIKLNLLHQFNH